MEMLKAGAKGYILKDCAFDELIAAINSISNDKVYLSPKITAVVVKDLMFDTPKDKANAFSVLSNREREVLQLI